jgi:hypothetical protein
MMEQRSLFGLSEHLERISKIGDPLEHDVFRRKHIMLLFYYYYRMFFVKNRIPLFHSML